MESKKKFLKTNWLQQDVLAWGKKIGRALGQCIHDCKNNICEIKNIACS